MKSKINLAIVFVALLTFFNASGQGFRFDDPNVIFKDAKGNTLPADSAKALVGKGSMNFRTSSSDDGKLIIVLSPMAPGEGEKRRKEEQAWIASKVGTKFPEVNLINLKGKKVTNQELENNYTVVNFWFIGCKPCVEEMPELNKLVEKYKSSPVVFLAPALDKEEALTKFLEKREFDYTVLPNAKNLSDSLGVTKYPTHVVLDKQGYIREIAVGGSNYIFTMLDNLIQKVMAGK